MNALLAQPDGKMIVVGLFTQIGTIPRKYLARLNANGTLDTSFTSGLTYASAPYVPRVLALQNDGKVLVVASYNFNRLNADGSADATFSASVNSPPQAVVAQPDGKILIGGSFSSVGSKAAHNLARLTSTGARDATFLATGTGVSGAVDTIGLQPDGKVLIGGEFTSVNGITRTRLARLTATGTLDTTFNPGSGADATVNLLVLQPDGKMLVGGNFAHFAGVACAGLVRVNADGTLDTTFVYNGAAGGTPTSLVVQSDGKVVLGGSFYTDGGNTWLSAFRLNSDGSTDTTFRAVVEAQISGTVALQADGKLVLGGGFATLNGAPRLGLARFNADGTLDAPYNAGINLNGAVNAVAVRGDGTVVIGGAFTLVSDGARNRVARLSANGMLDPSFDPGTGADGSVTTLAVQTDGKVLLGGTFANTNGTARTGLARLNADGTTDSAYTASCSPSGSVLVLAVQPDGKAVLAGAFTQVNGVARHGIARLNTDGTLDASFDPGTGANDLVKAVAVQADGKVLVGGTFTQFNGASHGQLARLNPDGSLDAAFQGTTVTTKMATPATVYGVTCLAVQADGKIFVGGDFTSADGVSRGALARLNADGSLDVRFNSGSLYEGYYYTALVVQTDGKPILAGSFQAADAGKIIYNVARYNADGSLDDSFGSNQGTAYGSCLALQTDGKVLVGGAFTSENSVTQYNLARFYGDATPYLPTVSYSFIDGGTRSTTFPMLASVNAHGTATTAYFQYGTSTNYGTSTPAQTYGSNANASLSVTLSGLQPSTTYHYRSVATNPNGIVYGADVAITTLSVAGDWRDRHFGTTASSGTASDNADPDGDGISNLLERALGLDPNIAGVAGLPTVSIDPTTHHLVLTATRGGADATDLHFTAEASVDLVTWTTDNLTVLTNTSTSYQVRDDGPAGPRRFLRLRVTQQ